MTKRERVIAAMLGIETGDAFGMPFETMSAEEILAATGGQGPTKMHDPVQRKIKDTIEAEAGAFTDDFQLTAVVAASLAMKGRFDVEDQAQRHVDALRTTKFGWGGTIKAGVQQFADFYDARAKGEHAGRPPSHAAPTIHEGDPTKRGLGTGPGMRVLPIGLFSAVRHDAHELRELSQDVITLGRMTHGDLRASFAALAIASVGSQCLTAPITGPAGVREVLESAIFDVEEAERTYRYVAQYPNDPFSGRLKRLTILFDDADAPIEKITGVGFSSMEAIPLAIGIFLRHHGDFRAALRKAVMVGGDTDTVAAMVGGLHGANGLGGGAIPAEWLDGLRDKGAPAREIGAALYDAAAA